MDTTEANTLALNINTIWIIISTIITIVLFLIGKKLFSKKNTIKNTSNRKGRIKQGGESTNIIKNVTNDNGEIIQE